LYERLQIESMLRSANIARVPGTALHLMTAHKDSRRVFEAAVQPAILKNDLNISGSVIVFDSDSDLAEVTRQLQEAEVIVADVGEVSADLLYILGLAHGLGRCPLLLTQNASALPFNLAALRWIEYRSDLDDLMDLREHLTRAIRVFLLASRARPH
jgi:hypothetical protein